MEQHINYKGKKYELKEPTIEMYKNVMKLKGLLTPEEIYIKFISELTGLSEQEIEECPADEVNEALRTIMGSMEKEQKEFFFNFNHRGISYKMIDVKKISFGQFVDIDSFLSKDEQYKMNNLEELASYLFIEENSTYKDSDFNKRKENFKDLPMKYLESGIFFLVSLGTISFQLTQLYSNHRILYLMMRTTILLTSIGAGIPQFPYSPKTIFGKLVKLLVYPLWLVSITLRSSWTKLKHKIKKQNS